MSSEPRVAIVGATGVVGLELLRIMEERNFSVADMKLLASGRSAGKELEFKGVKHTVEEVTAEVFEGVDLVFTAAGSAVSREFVPEAVKRGCVVIDKSDVFRLKPDVPLVVPEVNAHTIDGHNGIIANPNCSTIPLVLVLKPLHDAAKVKRVVVSTYQSVSGAGIAAVDELRESTRAWLEERDFPPDALQYQIAFNVIPQIGPFFDNAYCDEEMRVINESRKIMGDDSIKVTATTIRIPVYVSHSESVNIETEKKLTAEEARLLLSEAPAVVVEDDLDKGEYPMPVNAEGKDYCYVGRIREDNSLDNGLNLWLSCDNLRKGAALNAIQIAELLAGSL